MSRQILHFSSAFSASNVFGFGGVADHLTMHLHSIKESVSQVLEKVSRKQFLTKGINGGIIKSIKDSGGKNGLVIKKDKSN